MEKGRGAGKGATQQFNVSVTEGTEGYLSLQRMYVAAQDTARTRRLFLSYSYERLLT